MSDSEDLGTEYTVVNNDYVRLSKRVEIQKQERVNAFVVAITLSDAVYPEHMRTSSPGDVGVIRLPSASWTDLRMSKQYQLILVEVDESRNDHLYVRGHDDDEFETNVEDAPSEAPYDSVLDEATYNTMLEETAEKTTGNSILNEATYDKFIDDKIPF